MKICLAGTGAMGEIHVKALAKINDVQVVSVAGRTEEGVKEFATKWNIPYASTDLKACIDRPGVDAVILTTPSTSTPTRPLLALSMGKHVQVEIPMALILERLAADARRGEIGGKSLHGDAHAPVLEPAPRDSQAHQGRHIPPAPHGRRDVFLPADEPQHARPAAILGRQPALASWLPLGRSGALDPRRAQLAGLGPEGSRPSRRCRSRWT